MTIENYPRGILENIWPPKLKSAWSIPAMYRKMTSSFILFWSIPFKIPTEFYRLQYSSAQQNGGSAGVDYQQFAE